MSGFGHILTDEQTDRQADRQAGRQARRHTDRQTEKKEAEIVEIADCEPVDLVFSQYLTAEQSQIIWGVPSSKMIILGVTA